MSKHPKATRLRMGLTLSGFFAFFTSVACGAPEHIRVIWKEDPARQALISWSTPNKTDGNLARIWIGDATEPRAVVPVSARYGDNTKVGHHARIDGLTPATRISFEVESDGDVSGRYWFTTAPEDEAAEFRLLVGGDSRSGVKARQRINQVMAQQVTADPGILALAHGGDYIVSGKRWHLWDAWLSDHELTTGKDGRVLPVIPARGNHDGGPLYNAIFDLNHHAPDGVFTTRMGGMALVTLNTSTIPANGDQAVWLEAELKRWRPQVTWLLAQYHRPLYPGYKTPSGAKPVWAPIFERYNLDIALEADGHLMKRTVPIRAERKDPTGVTYIGEGGLGVPQRTPKPERWYLQEGGWCDKGHHVMVFAVGPNEMSYEVLALKDDSGLAVEVKDRFSWTPRGEAGARQVDDVFIEERPLEGTVVETRPIIARGSEWAYFAGDNVPAAWTAPDFDDTAWKRGKAGFGYGDDDDATVIDMRKNFTTVAIRKTFDVTDGKNFEGKTWLRMQFDDGFIAYLNGQEIARQGVEIRDGERRVSNHEAGDWELFPVPTGKLKPGGNVLAIAGYNRKASSSDFTLHPELVVEPAP